MRTDNSLQEVNGSYLRTIWAEGRDFLINGVNKYINFGSISGSSGYGIRDNGGVMQSKNSGGTWSDIGTSGGGGFTILPTSSTVNGSNTNFVFSQIPRIVVVDNLLLRPILSNGSIAWSDNGVDTVSLVNPPVYDCFGIA